MSVLLPLLASALWGLADFLGGTAARRAALLAVLVMSQGAGAIALAVVVPISGDLVAETEPLLIGLAAGLVAVATLGCFYRALAIGTMGVVAPIAALGVVVPVLVGLADGEQPSALQWVGMAVAVAGCVLASGPELRGGAGAMPLLLAAVAAVGFGVLLVLLAEGEEVSTGTTLLVMRWTSVLSLGVVLLVASARRPSLRLPRGVLVLAVLAGIGDASANGAYALGVGQEDALLSVTAVLASLYPVVTVLLARQIHAERLRPVQGIGVLTALSGVAMLAGG